MADQWELILHHTYAGTPGVVMDLSPQGKSRGDANGLSDHDFVRDGESSGSGAVDFHGGGQIDVVGGESWHPMRGLRIEVLFKRNRTSSFDHLVLCDTVKFEVLSDLLNVAVFNETGAEILRSRPTPANQWITATVTYDGIATAELAVDGQLVDRIFTPLSPLLPMSGLSIGPLDGLVDDVKMWRLNPHRVGVDFGSRPVNPNVSLCWDDWTRALSDALTELSDEDSECLNELIRLMRDAVYGGLARAHTHSEDSHNLFNGAVKQYREGWFSGDLREVSDVITFVIDGLSADGFDIGQDPGCLALIQSRCWQRLLELLPPLQCDRQFTDMLRRVGR